MRTDKLFYYLSGKIGVEVIKKDIHERVEEMRKLIPKKGSSISIEIQETEEDFELNNGRLLTILNDYLNDKLDEVETEYIMQMIEFAEGFSLNTKEAGDVVFTLSDPRINGDITKEAVKKLVDKLLNPNNLLKDEKLKKLLIVSGKGCSEEVDKLLEEVSNMKLELVSIWGKDCELLEEILDEEIVGDGSNEDRFITTTSHPDESLDEVKEFVAQYSIKELGSGFNKIDV